MIEPRAVRPGGEIGDTSNAAFEISPKVLPQLHVTRPDGGEKFKSGTTEAITWDNVPSVPKVDLHYSVDGGNTWVEIASNLDMIPNQYIWTVPAFTSEKANSLVRIRSHSDTTNVFDISGSPFSITQVAGFDAVAGVSGIKLVGNFPNPFADRTELRWLQPMGGDVEVRLYESNGTMVRSYPAGRRDAGEQSFGIRADGLASGMYIYEVRIAESIARGVMMVAR